MSLLTAGLAHAQTRSNSPYSRYGLGELHHNMMGEFTGLGELSLPIRHAATLNFDNPASLTAINSTIFMFGFYSDISRIESNSITNPPVNNSSSAAYMALGLRITKPDRAIKWSSALGLLPYSGVGYSVEQNVKINQVGNVKYRFDGSGGLNHLVFANGWQKGPVSVGLKTGYLFGKIDRERQNLLPVDSAAFNSAAKSRLTVGDFTLQAGVQLEHKLSLGSDSEGKKRDSLQLILAGTLDPQSNLPNTREDLTVTLINPGGITIDTINYTYKKGPLLMPLSWGVGLSAGQQNKNRKWLVGVDYRSQLWSNYTLFNQTDSLGNAHKLSIGGLYQPRPTAIEWRAGLFLSQTYYFLNSTPIKENGIAFGLGIPIADMRSNVANYLNLSFVIGQRGTTDNNLIREPFMRFTFGFTFQTMTWFLKRKYD